MPIIQAQALNLDPSALEQFASYLQDSEETAAMLNAPFMSHESNNNNAIVQ